MNDMVMKRKAFARRRIALFLVFILIIGLLPPHTPSVSQAADREISNPRTTEGVTTWDCIWFGNYWQEDTNGDGMADKNDTKMPIKWRVLSVDGDDAFLLADKNLDCQPYNEEKTSVTWETCTLRSWLNGYGVSENVCGRDYSTNNFFVNAFSAKEQSAIMTTEVGNGDNEEYGTEGGDNTFDKVYLLSIEEATNSEYGFDESTSNYAKSRGALNTQFAKVQGAYTSTFTGYEGNGDWWLRSPGYYCNYASYVDYYGYVHTNGIYVSSSDHAVRPALHLNLSSDSSWSYAGTVSSDGGSTGETAEPEITDFTMEGMKSGTEGHTISISGEITLDSSNATEKTLTEAINSLSFDTSDAAVAKVLSWSGSRSSDYCSAQLTIWITLYQEGDATITATASESLEAECQVTIDAGDDSDDADYEGDYSSDLTKILTNQGTFNVMKYLRNEANYTASSFVYEKDSQFGSKLTMAITDLCYRGWDGWNDLIDGSTSVEQAEKALVSLLDVYQSDCEALSKAKTAQKYAKMIHNAFWDYSKANNMFDTLNSGQVETVTDYFEEDNIAKLLYEGKYEDLMVGPNLAMLSGQETPKEWNALMEGFSKSAEMSSALKKGVNKLSGVFKNLGKCLKYLSLTQDTVNYIYQLESLMQADEMYCEMLIYVKENCKYSIVQEAAGNLYTVIQDGESAIIDDLLDKAENLAKDKVLDALIESACRESLVSAMCVSAFEWGVTISNTFFKTGSTQELKDMLRTEVFLGECLSRWMLEKEEQYYPAIGTEAEQDSAKQLYYSIYMLWQTRMCAEETLQSLLRTVRAGWSENYVASAQILAALESYYNNIFSEENLSCLIGVTVACPVDVEVYNASGTKLMTVKDGEESSGFENGIYYYCSYNPLDDDYVKYIYFDKVAGYTMKVIGNDLGLVDCNIFEILEEGKIIEKYFQNVQIQEGTLISLDSVNTEKVVYTVADLDIGTNRTETMETRSAEKVVATSLVLRESSLAMKKGTKQILTASIEPANATKRKVEWATDDESVATVNSDGVVSAIGAGTATITATLDKLVLQCVVTVTEDTTDSTEQSGESTSSSSAGGNSQTSQTVNKSGTENNTASVTKPSKTSIRSAKNKMKKRVVLSWKKVSGAVGYQIQYATNKKFKKKHSKLACKTSITIKKLKKQKTYYFRIRAYKLNGKKKVYGKWCKVKKVKIMK